MQRIKRPAVAGLFYPGSPDELQRTVDGFLRDAAPPSPGGRPRALIAPHAGYRYSGPIAANAYVTLLPWIDDIRRVAVMAPSHRVAFRGVALSGAEAFETPLGEIPVDRAAVATLSALPGVTELDAAFADEHALEVQLPFLQRLLGEFLLVPLVVGEAAGDDVARVVGALAGEDTLIVVSSDLSHYHPYDDCRRRDRATSTRIESLNAGDIGPNDACGAYPIRGLLRTAQTHGWHATTLDVRNSGDTSGDRSRVVGYGAYAFY